MGTPRPASPPGLVDGTSARPQLAGDPGVGCSTDDLRIFMIDQIMEIKQQGQAFELDVADQLNARSEEITEHGKNVADLKSNLHKFASDNDTKLQHANQVMEGLRASLMAFEKMVKEDVGNSMDAINKIALIEQELENNIKVAVGKLEQDIMTVHYLINDGNLNAKAEDELKGTGAMKLTQMQFEVAGIRAEYKKEITEIKAVLQTVRTSCERFMASNGDGSAQAASGRKYPCHCEHLDLLDDRVIVLENLVQARNNGRGSDPWHQPRAAASAPDTAVPPPLFGAPRHGPAHAAGDGSGDLHRAGYNLNRLFDDKTPPLRRVPVCRGEER